MAWKYPPNLIKGDYVVDSIAINENFLSVVEETSGYLNEHNFNGAFVLPRNRLRKSWCMKLFRSKTVLASSSNSFVDTVNGKTVPEGWVRLTRTSGYQTFADNGMTLTFTSRGGPTWLCASFNLHNATLGNDLYLPLESFASGGDPAVDANDGSKIGTEKGMGFNCALQLDGSILFESLIGSGDATNDYYVDKDNTRDKVYPKGGGGIQGAANAVVIEAVVDLEPGTHTVSIAIENILASNGIPSTPAVSSREIFALELTR